MKNIPNLLTLANLLSGTIACVYAVNNEFEIAAIFVLTGIIFDFFDGFVARLLNVSGELGKQLDSLADMVTSGVVPGIVMLKLMDENLGYEGVLNINFIPFIGLTLTLGACYRLAKFNLDTRQSESFIGLPTPAMSLFILSLPLILKYSSIEILENLLHNNTFLIAISFMLTYLMNSNIHLFSLKFKNFSLKENYIRYIFLFLSIMLVLIFKFLSIPIIIITYIIISLIKT